MSHIHKCARWHKPISVGDLIVAPSLAQNESASRAQHACSTQRLNRVLRRVTLDQRSQPRRGANRTSKRAGRTTRGFHDRSIPTIGRASVRGNPTSRRRVVTSSRRREWGGDGRVVMAPSVTSNPRPQESARASRGSKSEHDRVAAGARCASVSTRQPVLAAIGPATLTNRARRRQYQRLRPAVRPIRVDAGLSGLVRFAT